MTAKSQSEVLENTLLLLAAATFHSKQLQADRTDAINEGLALLQSIRASEKQEHAAKDGWLQDGGLLYRLTDERHPQNRDEINVTMADGSRSIEARTRRAGELLDRIRQSQIGAQRQWVGLTEDERNDLITTTTIGIKL